jgi:hypothetical protein
MRKGEGPGVANFGFLVPEKGGSAPPATIRPDYFESIAI